MYRYFVLIWNHRDIGARTTADHLVSVLLNAADWGRVLDAPGLAVLHSGSETQSTSCETRVLAEAAGAICGRVFWRGRELEVHPRSASLPRDETAAVVASRGAALVSDCWGRYIAVVRDPRSGAVDVLRDPSGAMPCFITRHAGVNIVFSDIESCLQIPSIRFSVNWKYIAAFVPYSALQISDTGLNEVTELQPGERATFRDERIERGMLWSPLDRREALIEDADEAIPAIRQMVRRCVHAWTSLHSSVVLNLSGGLDSSIVLSCLADAPNKPSVACVHYFAPLSREDERRFARLAASHFGKELIECPLDPAALRLERLHEIRRSPRPWFYIYDLEQGPLERHVAHAHHATGIFSGASGDSLFLQARAELSVADFLLQHGFKAAVLKVALNAARVTRGSMWPILRAGVLQHFRYAPAHSVGLQEVRSLVPPAVRAAAYHDDSLIHEWLRNAGRIPPGLRWHILTLSMPPQFYDSFGGEAEVERTVVLFSQPLIELCLRIPSYVWIRGGRDRALARNAFAPDLPPEIVRRTRKGAIDRHNRKLLDQNEAFMREMLLDGLLVKQGLLDRSRLESMLTRGAAPAGFEYNEVLRQHLCTEVWLRRWTSLTSSCGR